MNMGAAWFTRKQSTDQELCRPCLPCTGLVLGVAGDKKMKKVMGPDCKKLTVKQKKK